ncbi:MAG: phage shock protein PspA [Rhodospirillaceae bacterium]
MGIFSRLSDIVNANINAMLDRAEDPEKIIRLIILEMEDTLVEARSDAARLIAERKEVERRLDRLAAEGVEWEERAALALSKDREDLARAALVEKAKLVEVVSALEAEQDALAVALEKSEEDIRMLQEKLTEAKARQKGILARERSARTAIKSRRVTDPNKIEDALMRFESLERRVDGFEAEAEAMDMARSAQPSLKEEIRALEMENGIEAELEALKAKMKAEQ